MSFAEKNRVMKLHRKRSHASKEKLQKIAKGSKNFNVPEFLIAIEGDNCDCEIGEHYLKKTPLKPILGLIHSSRVALIDDAVFTTVAVAHH